MGFLSINKSTFWSNSKRSTSTRLSVQEKPNSKLTGETYPPISYTRVSREVLRELRGVPKHVEAHVSFGPLGDDLHRLQGIILGPSDTPYQGGIFLLSIEVPSDYPFEPPVIKFKTKVHHPNVSEDGSIDIDVLGPYWSPTLTIEKLLLSICSFICDPLDHKTRKSHNKKAKEWTKLYAMN